MDELVYRFLLQSGYPRAALIADLGLLPLAGPSNEPEPEPERRPAFAVVDPRTGDKLALVDAVEAVDAEALRGAADELGRYARRFDGESIQALLLRVDFDGAAVDEQMQIYRVWPTRGLERVSLKAFPDLDALRTWRLLADRKRLAEVRLETRTVADGPEVGAVRLATGSDEEGEPVGRRLGVAAWLPGTLLAGGGLADWLLVRLGGESLLDGTQALLLVGAAALLFAAALARAHRR